MIPCSACGHPGHQHVPCGGGCFVCACTAYTAPRVVYATTTSANSPVSADPKGTR